MVQKTNERDANGLKKKQTLNSLRLRHHESILIPTPTNDPNGGHQNDNFKRIICLHPSPDSLNYSTAYPNLGICGHLMQLPYHRADCRHRCCHYNIF